MRNPLQGTFAAHCTPPTPRCILHDKPTLNAVSHPFLCFVLVFFSPTTTQDWGVDGSMGVLTQHGYDAAKLMGKFQGQKYAGSGLPLDACSDMFVYCEEVSE